MTNITIILWGKEFTLPVTYEKKRKENILPEQIKAIESLPCKPKLIAKSGEAVKVFAIDKLIANKQAAIKNRILAYMAPQSFYVTRDVEPTVILRCTFRFDLKNEVSILYGPNRNISVCYSDNLR